MLAIKMKTIITPIIIKEKETSAFSPLTIMSLVNNAKKSPNWDVPFQIGNTVLFFLSKRCDNN